MIDRKFARALFWAALAVALTAALLPAESAPQLPVWDKAQHAVVFAVLTGLALRGYGFALERRIAVGLLAVGGLIEVLQAMPLIHRDSELMDWVADAAGIGAALLLSVPLRLKTKKPA